MLYLRQLRHETSLKALRAVHKRTTHIDTLYHIKRYYRLIDKWHRCPRQWQRPPLSWPSSALSPCWWDNHPIPLPWLLELMSLPSHSSTIPWCPWSRIVASIGPEERHSTQPYRSTWCICYLVSNHLQKAVLLHYGAFLSQCFLHVGGGFVHMVVFATYRIPWSGSSYTLQPRGRLARTKAPTDSPTSLGWLPWFRISYLKAACNLKWLRDGSTSTPSTLSWQSFHATAHRLLWEKGPWWRSTGCWRTWWQHLLHSLASINQNLTQITEPLPEVTNDHVYLLMQIHPKAAPPGFKTRCISWKTC